MFVSDNLIALRNPNKHSKALYLALVSESGANAEDSKMREEAEILELESSKSCAELEEIQSEPEEMQVEQGEVKPAKKPRAAFDRDVIRISENPSVLISIEGFALYVGRTKRAIEEMVKDEKLPAYYMVNPLTPGGHAQTWINREEWDEFARQLVQKAPPEWHEWKNRFTYTKKKRVRKNEAA